MSSTCGRLAVMTLRQRGARQGRAHGRRTPPARRSEEPTEAPENGLSPIHENARRPPASGRHRRGAVMRSLVAQSRVAGGATLRAAQPPESS